MWELEIILALCIIALGTIVSISDIKDGVVKNKVLLSFAILGMVLDVVYYGIFANDILLDFIVNFLIVAFISLLLFFTHSFAGGDCKYCIVLAILYPANLYYGYRNSIYTLCFGIGIAIIYGYFYLLISSIREIVKKKNKMSKEYVVDYLKNFFKAYITAMIYIALISLVNLAFESNISINQWIVSVICLIVAWIVGKYSFFKRIYIIIPVLLIDILLSVVLKELPISINPKNYLLVLFLIICQMTIRTNLYENVKVADVKTGMILSMYSSMLMQNSRVRGLPTISAEDLRSRLTQEEVDAIGRWAKSREVDELIIVKKVPFALFITLGYITYFLLRCS